MIHLVSSTGSITTSALTKIPGGGDHSWSGTYVVQEGIALLNDRIWTVNDVKGTMAMIDSGASASVCGRNWLQLLYEGQEIGRLQRSEKAFRFGDGKSVSSLGCKWISVWVESMDDDKKFPTCFRTDVIEGDMPLLISYRALVGWESNIDSPCRILNANGVPTKMMKAKSGHILVRLRAVTNQTR